MPVSIQSQPRVVRVDTENHVGDLRRTSDYERSAVRAKNIVDATLEATNALVAGTPLALVTGAATIAYGLYKIAWAASGHGQESLRQSGLKTVVAGLAAPIPVVGHVINAGFAFTDGFDAARVPSSAR